MPEPLPPVFLATAVEAVVRAGDVQMQHFGGALQVDKKGAIDLVTNIDVEIERAFRATIAERFPDHAVLGEEFANLDENRLPKHCWVFDPIDGTTNYAHGLPIFCSSLSLEINGEAIVAAIYDPSRRELFTAERGHGAWLNGQPLRVSSADALIDALLVTGFPYTVQQDPGELVGVFTEFLKTSRAVRRLGSAALDLCYVAAGRFDAFWEQKLNPWDISAGALIVQEAGGTVTDTAGAPFRSRAGNIIASNGRVHDAMVATLQGFIQRFRSRNWTE